MPFFYSLQPNLCISAEPASLTRTESYNLSPLLALLIAAASLTPAQFLGVENERGALVPGARADLVALTDDLKVVATWLGGVSDDGKGI